MPVGAAIGVAAGSIGGAAIASGATKKASKASSAAAADNNALTRSIYDSNVGYLSPFMARGNAAGDQINALLGLPTAAQTKPGGNVDWQAYAKGMPDAWAQWTGDPTERAKWNNDLTAFGEFHYKNDGSQRDLTPFTAAPAAAGNNALAAYETFRNSTGYQDRVSAATKAINTGYAAKGSLESGAAQKALQANANVLAGDYFSQYMAGLQGQQAVGAGSASALAGVGQNFAAQTSSNNNSAATTAGNAALANGAIWGNAINGVAGAAGSVFGSSYGGSRSSPQAVPSNYLYDSFGSVGR